MDYLKNGSIYLKVGSKGPAVKYIQQRLNISVDSKFGPGTDTAVKAFQKKNKFTVDGIVGITTFIALMDGTLTLNFNRTKKLLTLNLNSSQTSIKVIYKCRAISGLPKNHSRTRELIKQGRDELKTNLDYMLPKYDEVSDVGPIPDGKYSLTLTSSMKFQKTGGGWGVGGWFLDPGRASRFGYRIGWNRGGFFLHHDGNGVGTGGCIGVSAGSNMKKIKKILISYYNKGFRIIKIIVS